MASLEEQCSSLGMREASFKQRLFMCSLLFLSISFLSIAAAAAAVVVVAVPVLALLLLLLLLDLLPVVPPPLLLFVLLLVFISLTNSPAASPC